MQNWLGGGGGLQKNWKTPLIFSNYSYRSKNYIFFTFFGTFLTLPRTQAIKVIDQIFLRGDMGGPPSLYIDSDPQASIELFKKAGTSMPAPPPLKFTILSLQPYNQKYILDML